MTTLFYFFLNEVMASCFGIYIIAPEKSLNAHWCWIREEYIFVVQSHN